MFINSGGKWKHVINVSIIVVVIFICTFYVYGSMNVRKKESKEFHMKYDNDPIGLQLDRQSGLFSTKINKPPDVDSVTRQELIFFIESKRNEHLETYDTTINGVHVFIKMYTDIKITRH